MYVCPSFAHRKVIGFLWQRLRHGCSPVSEQCCWLCFHQWNTLETLLLEDELPPRDQTKIWVFLSVNFSYFALGIKKSRHAQEVLIQSYKFLIGESRWEKVSRLLQFHINAFVAEHQMTKVGCRTWKIYPLPSFISSLQAAWSTFRRMQTYSGVFKTHVLICRSQQSCPRRPAEESTCGAIGTVGLVSQQYCAREPQEPHHSTARHDWYSEGPRGPGAEEGWGPV